MESCIQYGNSNAAAFMRFKPFSSPFISNTELSEAIKETIVSALEQGLGFRDWRKKANAIYDAYGVSRLSTDQYENIFRNETAMSYGAANFASLQDANRMFPYFQYLTMQDAHVRSSHSVLDGKYFRSDDVQFFPPIGFGCRCVGRPVSRSEARRKGIEKPDIIPQKIRARVENDKFTQNKVKWLQEWLVIYNNSIS